MTRWKTLQQPQLLLDELEFAAQCKVVPVLVRAGVLLGAIDRAYEKLGATQPSRCAFAATSTPTARWSSNGGDASRLLANMERVEATIDDGEPPHPSSRATTRWCA